jgi:hypothetical protein
MAHSSPRHPRSKEPLTPTLSPSNGEREKRRTRAALYPPSPQLVANFMSLMASKSCTPPPTRFVV